MRELELDTPVLYECVLYRECVLYVRWNLVLLLRRENTYVLHM